MPEKKKQHFVPQFYLRRFTDDGVNTSAYLVNDRKYLPLVGIAKQCQKPYFYGKDLRIENAFGNIESELSKVLKSISNSGLPPLRASIEHRLLVFYIVSQRARTPAAISEYDEFSDGFMKDQTRRYANGDKELVESLDNMRIVDPNAMQEVFEAYLPMSPLLLDLQCIVLQNNTPIPFITCDNPIIFYNQLFESHTISSTIGMQNVGLQVFMPIDSKCCLMLYDSGVYGIGRRAKRHVVLEKLSDIKMINGLQIVNAVYSIYYHPKKANVSDVEDLVSMFARLRRSKKSGTIALSEKTGYFVDNICIRLKLKFLKYLPR